MDEDDPRLSPIVTIDQAARLIGRDAGVIRRWTQHTNARQPLVTTGANLRRGWPTIPIVGLAEAHTTAHLRQLGLSMLQVAAFADHLRRHFNDAHPLAVPKYVTEGAAIYEDDDEDLVEIFSGQAAFRHVLAPYLTEIVPWPDGLAGAYRPAALNTDTVEMDPRYNAGRLSFVRNRVPLFVVAGGLAAGDSAEELASAYRLKSDEVEIVEGHLEWLLEVA